MTEPTRQLLDLPRIDVPIVNAPMARIAVGALAGAVSTASGLGFVGDGYGDLDWIDEQLALAATRGRVMNTTHSTRPAGAPAYFLGRPATVWQIALRRQRRRSDDASPITPTTRDRRVASQHGAMP